MYFIDVQGTLIDDQDKSPIDGSLELIKYLNSKHIPYVIITNNTKKKSNDFLAYLRSKGLEIKDGAYIDPFYVLNKIIKPCKCAMFGDKEFISTMISLGYEQDLNSKNAVLIASYDEFKFGDFANINKLVLDGAKLIGMHETSIYKKDGRLYPGVGAIIRMISYATNANFVLVGKPSYNFYNEALNLLKLQNPQANFKDLTIISDDAIGDLKGAKSLGMTTNLVLSGKISDVKKSRVDKHILDAIYKNVRQILEVISERD